MTDDRPARAPVNTEVTFELKMVPGDLYSWGAFNISDSEGNPIQNDGEYTPKGSKEKKGVDGKQVNLNFCLRQREGF